MARRLATPIRVGVITPNEDAERWQEQAILAILALGSASVSRWRSRDIPDESVDVIIDFATIDGGASTTGRPSTSTDRANPPLGIWRYGFGDGSAVAAGAAGTLARLYRLVEDSNLGIVLEEGWFRSPSSEGPGTTSVESRVAPWCARALARLSDGEVEFLQRPPRPIDDCSGSRPPRQGAGWERIGSEIERWLRRERWTIGVVPVPIEDVLRRGSLPEPTWLAGQPVDRFYADPFPLEIVAGGRAIRILAEEYRYRDSRGRIVELEVGCDGGLRQIRARLAPEPHASYPFVFRDGGELFCAPETSRANRLSAFAFDSAADTWRGERTLVDGFPAVDATLLRRGDRWWLFCMHGDVENQTELHLFFASDWRGPWAPHRLNPVKSDARSSRPAGSFFEVDGALYRPAQNCARRYGGGLTINRVCELSEQRFREEPVLALNPGPAWSWRDGLHTINALPGLTVVDALRVERRFI